MNKITIALLAMFLPALVSAQTDPLPAPTPVPPIAYQDDINKVVDWFKAQDKRLGTNVSLAGHSEPITYLGEFLCFGRKGVDMGDSGKLSWVDLDPALGGNSLATLKFRTLVMFHIGNISGTLASRLSFKDHLKLPMLPDIQIGPVIGLPLGDMIRDIKSWKGREQLGIGVSMRLG